MWGGEGGKKKETLNIRPYSCLLAFRVHRTKMITSAESITEDEKVPHGLIF